MKIGNCENVTLLRLTHKGLNLNFKGKKPMDYRTLMEDVKPSEFVHIVFDDSMEINWMIAMLRKFKQECEDDVGRWNRTL